MKVFNYEPNYCQLGNETESYGAKCSINLVIKMETVCLGPGFNEGYVYLKLETLMLLIIGNLKVRFCMRCYLDVPDALVREFLNKASGTEIGEKGSISSGSHGYFPWGLHEHGMAFTQVHTWKTALLQKPNLQKNHTFSFPNAKSLHQSMGSWHGLHIKSIHGRLLC